MPGVNAGLLALQSRVWCLLDPSSSGFEAAGAGPVVVVVRVGLVFGLVLGAPTRCRCEPLAFKAGIAFAWAGSTSYLYEFIS